MTNNPASPLTEILQTHECWDLLRTVSVGRLAVWVADHPDIFPINYKVDHGTLVFRTGVGTKLTSVLSDTPVALEADGVNPDTAIAWSVVVKGSASAILATEDVLETVGLLLFPWHAGSKDHFIRIVPDSITGRRFTVTPPLTWWTALDDAGHASDE